MPVRTQTTEQPQEATEVTQIHPDYSIEVNSIRGTSFLQEPSTIICIDNSRTPSQFWARRGDTVAVNYPNGERKQHYVFDSTVILVREAGLQRRYVNKECAELEGYKFSARCKAYMKETDPQFYGNETRFIYHRGERAFFAKPEDKFKFGVEVEKEDSRYANEGQAWKIFQETGWCREADGSLHESHGYELISPVMPMDDLDAVREYCKPVKKLLDANTSSRCGGHFNISCEGLSSRDLLQNMREFIAVIYALYEKRLTNRYCHVYNFREYGHTDRYAAVLPKGNDVVEIRLFPAIKSVKNLIWRVRLMQIFFRRRNWNIESYMKAMCDTKSRLYGHLRQIFTHEDVMKKVDRTFKLHKKWVGFADASQEARCKAIVDALNLTGSTTDESDEIQA